MAVVDGLEADLFCGALLCGVGSVDPEARVLLTLAVHYVIDPVLGGSAKPDFETLFVLFGMVEVDSEVINAHLHVIRAQRLR